MPAINPGIYHRIKFTSEYEISCFRNSQFVIVPKLVKEERAAK